MARILLALMCLSGWPYSTCLQYHYVADPKTWTEAQTYCRQNYADLATIGNIEQNNQLIDTITSAGQSKVWMGLYSTIEWRWSDGFSGVGANYRNWHIGQPDIYVAEEFCALFEHVWYDMTCSHEIPFVCYNGSQLDPELFFVNSKKTWPSAQLYCRQNYVDLATVINGILEEKIIHDTGNHTQVWFGLHRDPNFFWSDGSNFTFSNWDIAGYIFNSKKVICACTSSTESRKWRFSSCEEKLPFVCYSRPHAKILKLKITPGNPAVDLNDPAVKEDLLKKLEERLKLEVGRGLKLKWRNPQDWKVFKKLHRVGPEDCNDVHV